MPGAQVVHPRYATYQGQEWRGIAPLVLTGTTGRLSANVESALRWETNAAAAGQVGSVVPLPQDASDPAPDAEPDTDQFASLKATIKALKGRLGFVETTSASYGDNRGSAPRDDWQPRRIGPEPPQALVELREQVEESVLSALGVPPGLATAAGGEARESFRRWYSASLLPMARLVESELSIKLDADVRLDFRELAAADVHGRARAWRSLAGTEATIDSDTARAMVGL